MLKKISQIFSAQPIDYYVFIILLFALPFGRSMFSPFLFLWFLLVLVSYFIKKDYYLVKLKEPLFLPVAFYLIYAISSLLTTDLKVGLNELQFKLPLLLIPILYPTQRESYRQGFTIAIGSFVIGCVVASLYFFGYAFYRSLNLVNNVWVFNPIPEYGWNNYFLSEELSYLIHPSYLSLFILIALLAIGLYIKKWWVKGNLFRVTVIFSIGTLITSLILLQSRTGILSFGLMIVIWILYLVLVKRKYLLGLFFLAGIIMFIVVLVNRFERYSETIKSLQKTASSGMYDNSKEDATAIRFWIWKSSLSVIEEHPIFGVGAYNVKEYLNQEYIKHDMKGAASVKLNAHNQFLETWLGMGVFGLTALLMMFIIPLWIGLKRNDWFLVGFILLCALGFMFESMLERIVGIVFFVLFYTILISTKPNLNIKS